MALTQRQVLVQAKALITDIDHWDQGAPAKDAAGLKVDPWDASAHCYCADGALASVLGQSYMETMQARCDYRASLYGRVVDLLDAATRRLFPDASTVDGFSRYLYVALNDGEAVEASYEGSHNNILCVFDEAIANALA